MSRRKAPLHLKQFIGGLNTVESPLEGTLQTTKDELNMILNNDGSRQRRLGMDQEPGGETIVSSVTYSENTPIGKATYRWEGAGGDTNTSIAVIQIGNQLFFFSLKDGIATANQIHSKLFDPSFYSTEFSFADVDGILAVATGEKTITVFEYDPSTETISESETTLYIRDLFGVEAYAGSVNLTTSQQVENRPTVLSSEHLYNLRNQTFSIPRFASNDETLTDPIKHFYDTSATYYSTKVYPSNSDQVNPVLKADASDAGNRTAERFFANDLFAGQLGSTEAPRGYFIIDALERGASRIEQETALRDRNSQLVYAVSSLPTDRTPGGPSVITQHAGRVWYAGFSGVVEGGDPKSPRMNSYLLFSSLVKDITDIGRCYQFADPTSPVDPDIVDTDGGFIRIEGAQKIVGLKSNGQSLFVFATNGVWTVSGQNNEPFRATSYVAQKISERGAISAGSIVIANDIIYFWSNDGIYVVAQNEVGLWSVQNITKTTIQPTYNEITDTEKKSVSGFYDDFEQTVRWVYNPLTLDTTMNYELVFDTGFNAFTKNGVPVISGGLPRVLSLVGGTPFTVGLVSEDVTVNGVVVTANALEVTSLVETTTSQTRETLYVVITDVDTTIQFTICYYTDTTFYDWSFLTATDYDSYIVSQFLSGGEPRTRKVADYVYCIFKRTENGFDSELNPLNASSCLLSGRFDWNNSSLGNKWSTPRQAYRYKSLYTPSDPSDTFDTGEDLIVTRNKVRGFGNSVAFKFASEEGKNLHIYGWSFNIDSSGDD